jgi:hypothetical protein
MILTLFMAAAGLAAQGNPAPGPGVAVAPVGIRQEARADLLAASAASDSLEASSALALLGSGLEQPDIAPYLGRLQALAAKARAQVSAASQPPGEALLVFLHSQDGPFRRYQARQTRVDVLLDTGTFNCVSSAVVYWLMAMAIGLDVGAVGTRDHAFCTLRANGRTVDVETTIAYGYDPGRRQDFKDAFGKMTGIVWVPPGNYSNRQDLDFRHLLGLILQNLAADAQERHDDRSPVGLAWDGAALVGLADARPLLATAYHNRAAGLNAAGDYAGAMAVVRASEARLGVSRDSGDLAQGIAANLVTSALARRDWAGAHARLAEWRERLGDQAGQLAVSLFRLESQDVYRTGGWKALSDWLDTTPMEPEVGAAERDAAWEMGATGEVARLTKGGDWEAGGRFLAALPARLAALPGVLRAGDAVSHNIVAAYHNRFAALANAGKLDAAREVLSEARGRYPADRLLLQDKAALDRR